MAIVKSRTTRKKRVKTALRTTGAVKPLTHDLAPSEWPIMEILWEKSPCPAGQVQEDLRETKNWAYSTVKTTMDRMAKKGLLRTEALKNVTLYFPNITREQAQAAAIAHTRTFAFRGSGIDMLHFMLANDSLPKEELEKLRQEFISSVS